ncbi:MAG: porin [Bacteroidia bacterium]
MKKNITITLFLITLLFLGNKTKAQFLMDMVDTTKSMGKGMFDMYNRFNYFSISGYIQPQFQMAETKGAAGFSGGSFDSLSDNRFTVRRGRIRFDYLRNNEKSYPKVHFVFQYDITERGAFVRDFWGRIYDSKFNMFSFTSGIFARPFGYEINLGSADRESPERGRMSQTLAKVERDLGAMISLDPKDKNSKIYYLRMDFGIFNGQGIGSLGNSPSVGVTEYDSQKDFIGRVGFKAYKISKHITISGGLSGLYGGLAGLNKATYKMGTDGAGNNIFKIDTSQNYAGKISERQYNGVDFQAKYSHKWGNTEIRFEYWKGTQSATSNSSETPNILATNALYVRNFDGAFIYFLQNIINKRHQIAVKYDWYDPNTIVGGDKIVNGAGFSKADLKYTTLGFGYINYFDPNVKLVLWYDSVTNENTQLTGYTGDLKDDVFTARLQFRF